MADVRLFRRRLDLARVARSLPDDAGGVVLFAGRVRPDRVRGGRVEALYYEAHEPLAIAALERVARLAERRFGLSAAVLHHRLGLVPVGETAVIVAAAASHRDAAFRGARFLIDQLKRRAPIWKSDRARPARPRRRRPGRRPGRSSG